MDHFDSEAVGDFEDSDPNSVRPDRLRPPSPWIVSTARNQAGGPASSRAVTHPLGEPNGRQQTGVASATTSWRAPNRVFAGGERYPSIPRAANATGWGH